jgi:hypothetical protein
MSALLTPPPVGPILRRSQPGQKRWTRKQFQYLGDLGLFEGCRAMLIRGEIWEEGPMDPPHATGVSNVLAYLFPLFPADPHVRVQMPLDCGADTEPHPDFAVVPGRRSDYSAAHPARAELVIEVADSSLQFDLTTKAELYATARFPEYWVLDVIGRELHVLRDPGPLAAGGTAYRDAQVIDATGSVTPLAAPTATARIADLLP